MSSERFSLTLVVSHMGLGGAQRALANLLTYWAENTDWDIALVVLSGTNEGISFPIPGRVTVHTLYSDTVRRRVRGVGGVGCDIFLLRQYFSLRHSSLVISFMDTVNIRTVLALIGLRIPHIITEHAMPSNLRERGLVWGLLRKWVYRGRLLVVPSRYLGVFYKTLGASSPIVIGNPVRFPSVRTIKREGRHFIAAGRFEHEKGFDILIAAFCAVYKKYPDARLTLFGAGSQKLELERLILSYEMRGVVSLREPSSDLAMIYGTACAAVVPSRREAFGNAIIEAMAHRVPVIVSDCVSAPCELVRSQQAGLVVPRGDVRALSEAMLMLVEDPWLGTYLAANAASSVEKFNLEVIAGQWRVVMHKALNTSWHMREAHD